MTGETFEALEFVSESGRQALRHLGQKLGTGDVVLFAGAGLSRNARAKDGGSNRMPTWNSLAAAFLRELDEETRRSADVLKAADYYEATYGRPSLVSLVERMIADRWHEPGRVHRCIAELNFREIVTTNYDTLLERAFSSLQLVPQVVVTGTDLVNRRSPRVIKMNGCIDRNAAGIVITTDDFLAYPAREPLIEAFVMRCFVESRVLFAGFGLNDPTFRIINERVRRLLGNQCPTSYSLQLRVTEAEARYWRAHDVELIALGLPEETSFAGEDRLYRLLRALLAMQRSATVLSDPVLRAATETAPAELPHAVEAMLHVAPALDRPALELELESDPRLKALLRRVYASSTPHSRVASESATVVFLRAAAGLSETAAVELYDPAAEETRRFAELVIEGTGDHARGDVVTLALLVALRLILVGSDCNGAEVRVLRAASKVPTRVDVDEMPIRARHLLMAMLFAPLDRIVESVREANCATDKTRTHDEYRLPLLAFLGIPEDQPEVIASAAESLWSRQLALLESGNRPRARSDAELRYRFLLRFASRFAREWEGWTAHAERLSRVAGPSALRDSRAPASSIGTALRDVLDDLEHGWLAGMPEPPRGLADAWRLARHALARGEAREVPVQLLLWLSLTCDAAIEMRLPILLDAWHQETLDARLLLERIAARIGKADFTSFSRARASSWQAPIVHHERGLAALAAWLFDRIDEEESSSPLRADAARIFAPTLAAWLLQTNLSPVREHLLHIVALLTQWGTDEGPHLVRSWVGSRLNQQPTNERLRMPELAQIQEPLLDRDQMRLLLARAASGGGFQIDVEEYLFRWVDHPSFDERLVRELAADVAQWLEPEAQTFEWIARAARVRASRRLTAEVAQLDPVRRFGTIGGYVISRLRSLPSHEATLWSVKRSAFLDVLSGLVGDLSADDRAILRDMVLSPGLTPDGRNGAAILAARMLECPQGDEEHCLSILANAIEAGATGWGRLGASVRSLPPEYSRLLEHNLLLVLGKRRDLPKTDIVEWIGETIRNGADAEFPELEAELCSLLTADQRPAAFAATNVLASLSAKRPEVVTRNAHRILRARAVLCDPDVPARYRATSSFMRTLESFATAAS